MDLSDAEAIEASFADPSSFGLIFERHCDAVHRFAVRRVGRDAAGDIVGETFVRSFAIRARFDLTRDTALPWLYGIAANVIFEHYRRSALAARYSTYTFRRGTGGDPIAVADDRLVAVSLRDELISALGALSVEDRETLLLYALEDLSYKEIAAALGIPVGTVGSRMSRVRTQIRNRIPDLEWRVDRLGAEERGDDEPDA